jgi:hypothetical protein
MTPAFAVKEPTTMPALKAVAGKANFVTATLQAPIAIATVPEPMLSVIDFISGA